MDELRRIQLLLLCGVLGVWFLCTITADTLLHRYTHLYHKKHHDSFMSSNVHAMSSRRWCRLHHHDDEDDDGDHSDDDGYNDIVFNPARYSILPVLHNVESHHCDELSRLLVNLQIPHCSLSLRHPTALQSMSSLRDRLRSMDRRSPWKGALGISTVTSTDQVSRPDTVLLYDNNNLLTL